MKIICESQEEYNKLMDTSRYLHEFMISIDKVSKKTKIHERTDTGEVRYRPIKGQRNLSLCLDNEYKLVGFLQHLYVSKEDWEDKDKYVFIEGASCTHTK